MSGKIEEIIEPFFNRIIPKLPGLKILSNPGEMRIAFIHIWFHLAFSLIFVCIGLSTKSFVSYGVLMSIIMVIIAELPSEGRRIDIVTRGFGALIGAVPGLFVAAGYVFGTLISLLSVVAMTILYLILPKDKV